MVGFRHLFLVSSLRQFLGSICELDGLRLQLRTVTMRSLCMGWAFPWAAAVTRAPERCSAPGAGGACLSLVYGELVALLLNLESGFVRIGHGARLQRLGLLVRLLWAAEALLDTRRQGSAPLSFPFGALGARCECFVQQYTGCGCGGACDSGRDPSWGFHREKTAHCRAAP